MPHSIGRHRILRLAVLAIVAAITVLIPGDASMLGQYFTVEITGTTGSTFTGQLVKARQPLPMAV